MHPNCLPLAGSIALLTSVLLAGPALRAGLASPERLQQADGEPLPIDTNHSTIGFSVPIAGGLSQVTGKFSEFEIELVWDEAEPTRSLARAVIKAASIDTGIEDRDEDLRSPNFFDAARYPDLTFESRRVERRGEAYVAFGRLTMHGVTRDVELPFRLAARDKPDGGRWLAFTVEDFVIDRTDYGIDWEHNLLPFFVGNEVGIDLFVITR